MEPGKFGMSRWKIEQEDKTLREKAGSLCPNLAGVLGHLRDEARG